MKYIIFYQFTLERHAFIAIAVAAAVVVALVKIINLLHYFNSIRKLCTLFLCCQLQT